MLSVRRVAWRHCGSCRAPWEARCERAGSLFCSSRPGSSGSVGRSNALGGCLVKPAEEQERGTGQARKGAWWMPRRGQARKDVASCEKPRGAARGL